MDGVQISHQISDSVTWHFGRAIRLQFLRGKNSATFNACKIDNFFMRKYSIYANGFIKFRVPNLDETRRILFAKMASSRLPF